MELFLNMIFIFFMLLSIVGTLFLIESIFASDKLFILNPSKYVKELIEGVIFGILGVIFQIIFYYLKMNIQPQMFIILGIFLCFKKTMNIAVIGLTPAFIYYMFIININNLFFSLIIITFFVMLIILLLKEYSDSIIVVSIPSIINISLIFVVWIIAVFAWKYEFNLEFFIITTMSYILSYLVYIIDKLVENFLISANSLYKSLNFNFSKYYRQSLALDIIKRYISQNKIKNGIYGIFEIVIENKLTKEMKNIARKKILRVFENKLPQDAILFKATNDNYGFFIKSSIPNNLKLSIEGNFLDKRLLNDELTSFETILNNIPTKFKVPFSFKSKVYIGITYYGTQTSSTEELPRNAEFALQSSSFQKNNRVSIFNPTIYKKRANDYIQIKDLHNVINISFITNEYFPILDIKNNDTIMNVVHPITSKDFDLSFNAVLEYVEQMGVSDILYRYLASQALTRFEKSFNIPLAVKYDPLTIMESNFSPSEFVHRFSQYKLGVKDVILIFDIQSINKILEINKFISIVKKLKSMHLKIAISNVLLSSSMETIKSIGPHYIMLDKNVIPHSSFLNTHAKKLQKLVKFSEDNNFFIIANKIINEFQLDFFIENGINYVGGEFFGANNLKPKLFDKKSKIYITQLIKGGA